MARARGFTLVEVMIVVAMLGVLGTLAVSTIEPMVRRLRLRQAAVEAAEAIARARTEAPGGTPRRGA